MKIWYAKIPPAHTAVNKIILYDHLQAVVTVQSHPGYTPVENRIGNVLKSCHVTTLRRSNPILLKATTVQHKTLTQCFRSHDLMV